MFKHDFQQEELNLDVNQIWIQLITVVENGTHWMSPEDHVLWSVSNLSPLIQW